MKYRLRVFFTSTLAIALTGCVSEDFLGDAALMTGEAGQISFQSGTTALTRSTQTGADAAAALNNHFVVYGTKHVKAEDKTATNDAPVFKQYTVEWTDNTAGTTQTNTNNWEYIGKTSYNSDVTTQTAKFWDLDAANGYTFYAVSSPKFSYPAGSDSVTITKLTTGNNVYAKGYTLTTKKGAGLNGLYFSDRKTVEKADYGKPVQLTFRPFGVKVRMGFYETIPGYTVKINRFYYEKDAKTVSTSFGNMTATETTKTRAALPNIRRDNTDNQFTITYTSSGSTQNQPSVTYNTTGNFYWNLAMGKNCIEKELGTSAATATYDQADGAFNDYYPYEAVTNPMLLKCDYTITSEESTAESLTITGAKAIVPAEFVNWKMGHTYTYLFKISLSSSGTTGESGDPEGLYSISFDAVAESTTDNDQTTLTSIDQFNITTYKTTDSVYVVNTNKDNGNIYIPTALGDESGNAQLYYVTSSGEDIDETTIYARLIGVQNGLTLEPVKYTSGTQAGLFAAKLVYQVPAGNGTYYTFGTKTQPGALSFAPEVGHAYAYVYCKTKHQAPTYTQCTDASVWSSGTQYYTYSSGSYTAATPTEAEFNANKTHYYTQTSAGVTGIYAVMMLDTRTS